jgi:hypothetical protein
MQPKITPKISNTRHFGYPKIQVWVLGIPFYSISMLQRVKKELNSGEREQIRSLIMHVIICDFKENTHTG